MREIHLSSVTDTVKKFCIEANYALEPNIRTSGPKPSGASRSRTCPPIVLNDCRGGDLCQDGMKEDARE